MVALSLAICAGTGKAAAADSDKEPAFNANPSAVDARKFSSREQIRVQVRLTAGSKDLSRITLSTFSNDDVAARVEGGQAAAEVDRLPAYAEHVWTLLLKPTNGSAFPPAGLKLYVDAAFVEGTNPGVARTSFTTVTISGPSEIAVPTMADVQVKGALSALSFERPAMAFVVVTNKYSSDLKITDIHIHGPPFARFEPRQKAPYPLAYGGTKVIEFDVTAPDQVVPGKYPVVVEARLQAADGIVGSATTSPEVDVGVLGESDLLSKIGAPSLLFLPGVLFLLTWQLLWMLGKSTTEREAYFLKPTAAAFWLIGVVISLVTAIAYPPIINLFVHQKRDYLVAYGLRDYMYVFALAILAAVVAFLIWLALQWIIARVRAYQLSKSMPSINDKPLDILDKLARCGAGTTFRQAHIKDGDAAQLLLVLEPWTTESTLWLAPPIQLNLIKYQDYDAVDLHDEILTGQHTDAAYLSRRIKKGKDNGWWTIGWATVGNYDAVVAGPVSAWDQVAGRARLVR